MIPITFDGNGSRPDKILHEGFMETMARQWIRLILGGLTLTVAATASRAGDEEYRPGPDSQ